MVRGPAIAALVQLQPALVHGLAHGVVDKALGEGLPGAAGRRSRKVTVMEAATFACRAVGWFSASEPSVGEAGFRHEPARCRRRSRTDGGQIEVVGKLALEGRAAWYSSRGADCAGAEAVASARQGLDVCPSGPAGRTRIARSNSRVCVFARPAASARINLAVSAAGDFSPASRRNYRLQPGCLGR